ncbi:hypothetical protein F4820DRAFT_168007 [Hypoxylon rubiginosum]|uniref:Uncharacterized protein n=1 Tax=Hypoxylon rubiginosum TaxID=110542 RepID=A0ACB9YJS9_9PEZI|nr:hypothetical protein F4820DRAFT_168007 [Hypoxylon rubiginosum]
MSIAITPIRKPSDTIHVCYRDTFLVDGSSRNESIAAIAATKPHRSFDWRGPIVAYGLKGLGIDPTTCRDLDMDDFRHITDLFLTYGSVPYEPTSTAPTAPTTQQSIFSQCLIM